MKRVRWGWWVALVGVIAVGGIAIHLAAMLSLAPGAGALRVMGVTIPRTIAGVGVVATIAAVCDAACFGLVWDAQRRRRARGAIARALVRTALVLVVQVVVMTGLAAWAAVAMGV